MEREAGGSWLPVNECYLFERGMFIIMSMSRELQRCCLKEGVVEGENIIMAAYLNGETRSWVKSCEGFQDSKI